MISSAGSLRKSRRLRALTTANVKGQTWTLARNRSSSESSRSSSMRPSSASLASSHKTMAEIPQRAVRRIRPSRDVTSPVMAWSRMWVSRLSMPLETRREDVPFDLEPSLQLPDELCRLCSDRNQLGNRFSSLRNDDAIFAYPIEKRKALFFELRGRNLFHREIIALVTLSVHFPDGLARGGARSGGRLRAIPDQATIPSRFFPLNLAAVFPGYEFNGKNRLGIVA